MEINGSYRWSPNSSGGRSGQNKVDGKKMKTWLLGGLAALVALIAGTIFERRKTIKKHK